MSKVEVKPNSDNKITYLRFDYSWQLSSLGTTIRKTISLSRMSGKTHERNPVSSQSSSTVLARSILKLIRQTRILAAEIYFFLSHIILPEIYSTSFEICKGSGVETS